MNRTSFLFFVILAISCNSVKHNDRLNVKDCGIEVLGVPTYKNSKHSWRLDSIQLPITEFVEDEKPIFSRNGNRLLLSSPIANNIYLIDITRGLLVRTIPLVREPGYVKSVGMTCNCSEDLKKDIQGISFYMDNQVLLQREGVLEVLNDEGGTVKQWTLTKLDNKREKFMYSNIYESPVFYDSSRNEIRTFRYCYQCIARSKDAYSRSILATVNPGDFKVQEENFYYPEMYGAYHLGFSDIVYSSDYGNRRFFSFHPDHTIYVYDFNEHATTIYPGLSPNATNCIKILDEKQAGNEFEVLKQVMYQETYCQPVYDDVNRKYYRLFRKPAQVSETARMVVNELYIQIFDENFNHLDEVKVPTASVYYYAVEGGIQWPSFKKGSVILYSLKFTAN